MARAQGYPVVGVVRDTAGRGIPGVEVILVSPRRATSTDDAGRFRLDGVPGGDRRLLIRRIGYLAVRPSLKIPLPAGDTVRAVLLPMPQQLAPIVVESDQPGIRGVVGDSAFHAIPNALVDLLGSGRADTTDGFGRFAFEGLKQGQYVLRVVQRGYYTRFLAVKLAKRGVEYSIILDPLNPRVLDWATTRPGMIAMQDLGHRLATEPARNRMTRSELAVYGTMALCDVPRLKVLRPPPTLILRGEEIAYGQDLCSWTADELELIEWGTNPCTEIWSSIAQLLNAWCGARRAASFGNSRIFAVPGPYAVIWPRG